MRRTPLEPTAALLAALGPLMAAAGCAGPAARQGSLASSSARSLTDAQRLAHRVEQAHGIGAWRSRDAVACDVVIHFGGRRMLSGSMVYDHHGGRSRIETSDGTLLVFDGARAWVSPAGAEVAMARFHLLTWPYFLAAPFKLRDPGTDLAPMPPADLEGVGHERARLTFDEGVGDTPDDWYVLYVHPETGRLEAMAYIVTYGTPVERAEQEPHAILYRQYAEASGVLLSTRWIFTHWSEAQGPHGEPIGRAELSNVRFISRSEELFARPADAREDPLPQPDG